MSEAYVEGSEAPEPDEHEDAPEEEPEGDESEEEEEGEESEEDSAARLKRAEKQAHDKAGLAAKERSKRRAAERQVSELSARIERLESKGTASPDDLADLVASLRDDDDEPITDINQIKKVLKTFIARQQADAQAEGQRTQVVQTIQKISRNMDAFEKDFTEDHPDYLQAATFYRSARQGELEDLGYTGDRLMQKLAQELFNLTDEVMASGRDPAEAVYNLARKRGFKSGKAAADAKLQKLQKAGDTAHTPRSKGQDNGLTWMRVANAKGEEKDRLFKKLRAQELGKG